MTIPDFREPVSPEPVQRLEGSFRIGVDARKLGDYGIGDYLWNLLVQLRRIDATNQYVLFHQTRDEFGHPAGPPNFPPLPADHKAGPAPLWVRDDSGKYSLREQVSLPWLSWRHKLDLLHCPHYVTPLVLTCPLVVTIHDVIHLALRRNFSLAAQAYSRFMLHRAAAAARRIITVSEGSRRDILTYTDADPARVVTIYNGIGENVAPVRDPGRLAAARHRYGITAPYLLFVGNARMRHKNVVTLLRAFRILRERRGDGATLVLVGGLPRGGPQAEWVAAAGTAWGEVRSIGFVAHEDLPALYSGAELFVWPSLYEGFGIPPLEAMACGTPVVSSDAPVMPEVLGDAALLVPALDAEAYAAAIARVLDDAAIRADLVNRGFDRSRRYSWAEHARRTLTVYQEAIAEGRPGSG